MSTEHLSDQQIARIEALQAAQPLIGRKSEGMFKGVEPVDVNELVDLSEYILTGDHPMKRFFEHRAILIPAQIVEPAEGEEQPDASPDA